MRTFLLFPVLAALPMAWWGVQVRDFRTEQNAIRLLPNGVGIRYSQCGPTWMQSIGFSPKQLRRIHSIDISGQAPNSKGQTWSHPNLEAGNSLDSISSFSDPDLEKLIPALQQLQHLKGLALAGTGITNTGLSYLQQIDELEFLNVQETRVTQEALWEFAKASPRTFIAPMNDLASHPNLERQK